MQSENNIVVAVTGASGGVYALRLLDCLESAGRHVHVVISTHGRQLLEHECGVRQTDSASLIGRASPRMTFYSDQDLGCRLASGSFVTGGMVICPCSSNTLGAVASGRGDTLVTRSAHVALKESRRLVVVHREMPLNTVDLENMLRLQRAGAVICPAAPGFYLKPKSIDDLVDFVVGRVLDLLQVPHTLAVRWPDSA